MAKKRENPTEQQDESVSESDTALISHTLTTADSGVGNLGVHVTFKEPDERTYRTSFALSYGVLVALIDLDHVDADYNEAARYGLIGGQHDDDDQNTITPIGNLVLSGIDQTAIRHKMLAGWRAAHNVEVDSAKARIKKD